MNSVDVQLCTASVRIKSSRTAIVCVYSAPYSGDDHRFTQPLGDLRVGINSVLIVGGF